MDNWTWYEWLGVSIAALVWLYVAARLLCVAYFRSKREHDEESTDGETN